ncbi:MAG: CopG family transcriptional regulator [Defluviitaleaceae bacterium]|nr:CopG family transcriptional regulator [Defluviitaleaceae bacterium]
MGDKKIGRPTDNPKDYTLKVRLDKKTKKKLEECVNFIGASKAEVIRRGIHREHGSLNEQK